jgi:hypothetical protein
MGWLPDHILIKVVRSIDACMTRPRYEELLVELQFYSFDTLRYEREYYKLNKRSLIITSFKEKDGELLLNALEERGALNDEAKQALASIGFEIDRSLAGILAQPVEEHSRLEAGLRRLGLEQVQGFLDQSMDNYIQKHYEASNSMTRTALEHLVEQVAIKLSSLRNNEVIPQRGRYLSPTDYRVYLATTGFIDNAEKEFLDKFYGYASTDGSHPGISSEAEARLRRFVVVAIALFYTEKLKNDQFMKACAHV